MFPDVTPPDMSEGWVKRTLQSVQREGAECAQRSEQQSRANGCPQRAKQCSGVLKGNELNLAFNSKEMSNEA